MNNTKSLITILVAILAAVIFAVIALINSFMMRSKINELEQVVATQQEIIEIHTELLEKQAEINEDFLGIFEQLF